MPDGGWLPTIAMGLGVIVAGLGIGALIAVLMQRNSGNLPAVAAATSTPLPSRALGPGPIAIATIEPPRTPRPSPSAQPAAPATAVPTLEPTAPSAPSPTLPPTTAVQVPVAAATPALVAAVTPTPSVSPSNPPAETPPPAAAAETSSPAPLTSPVAAAQTPSTYDEHASAVVRRYLDALIRGDERTAYSALGSSGGTLSERSFLDPSARIVSVKVTRLDASNASVGCEIATAKGRYYATYHITAATSGPYISEHDYIRV